MEKGLSCLALIGFLLLAGCEKQDDKTTTPKTANTATPMQSLPAPHYVGGQHCASCHQPQQNDWHNSHHDLAMQTVSADTVLGDFNNASVTFNGVTTTFSRNNDAFLIRTDGADGKLATFPVAYVFGVYPLQQYLLALPGGKYQAFSISWDARPKEEGGQRWFHLYPDETITHTDPLHWTRPSQNWNFMCAECHSTQLDKNYDAQTRQYNTTWSDIDVSCEACHGPASNHLLWSEKSNHAQYRFDDVKKGLTHLFNERDGVSWQIDPATQQPKRSIPRTTSTEIQVCAACHSRRSQFFEDDRKGQPYMHSYLPSTLNEHLYHVDGQVDDEVYVYGSFLQSKMHQAGVTCSDCHNPHSLALKAPGNGVCLQCHTAPYDSPQHHHHNKKENAPLCADCHMPVKNFMVVDGRHDHSFRVPRPDLSVELGVPNACTGCHENQSAEWAAQHTKAWYGAKNEGEHPFAPVFAQARQGNPDAANALQTIARDRQQPAIVRATALRLLANFLNEDSFNTLRAALQDSDAQVRTAAIQSMQGAPAELRWQALRPLLTDEIRLVRVLAAEQLADIPLASLSPDDQRVLQLAQQEYRDSQRHNADNAQSQLNQGLFALQQGDTSSALQHYQEALALDDSFLPAYVNLADLYRQLKQDEQGKALLQKALQRYPDSADVYFSLGLLQVRQQDQAGGLKHLEKAAELAPDNSHYQYVYAVALHSAGRSKEALTVTEKALAKAHNHQLLELRMQLKAGQ